MTPTFAVVGIETPQFRCPPLWLPVFLLWIPVLLLAPLIFVVLLAVCIAGRISFWRAITAFWAILCSLPGTDVRVSAENTRILVRII
ncbi:MAG: hypothetical protein ABSC76_13575 [Terracidiphilus sp.]|jgi:hypothetical protein